MNKVIITGAGGFIGGRLAAKLLSQNVTVIGIDISRQSLERFSNNKLFVPVVADFSEYRSLSDLIKEDNIDVFYHFAWGGNLGVLGNDKIDYSIQNDNISASCEAIRQASKLKCNKFIFAGSKNELEINHLLISSSNPRSAAMYSIAKQAAEAFCKTMASKLNIEFCSGLIANVYGEGSRSKVFINSLISTFLTGKVPKLANGNQVYDLVYVDDVADAFIAIGKCGKKNKRYYVGRNEALPTLNDVVCAIRDIICPRIKLCWGEYDDNSFIDYSQIEISSLFKDSGFIFKTDFEESILNTAAWIARNVIKEEEVNKNMLSVKMLSKLGEINYL